MNNIKSYHMIVPLLKKDNCYETAITVAPIVSLSQSVQFAKQ